MNHTTEKNLPVASELIKGKIKEELRKCEAFSCTSDIWSGPNEGFIRMFPNKRKCSFNPDWEKQYTFVKRSRKGNGFFYCAFCQKDINVESMGVSAIKSHTENKEHKQIKEERRKSTTIENFVRSKSTLNLALQKSNLTLPDLISIMEQFRAKIKGRLHGTGNSGRPFFGGHFALRRASTELEKDFCNFYKIVLKYIDRWFQLQLLPKNISWTNLQNHPLNYAEVVQLAEQICPEIAQLDELFDEVSAVNQTLADIPEEFWLKSAEDKWKGIFEADGATEAYANLYRIVSAAFSIPTSNAFVERAFSLASSQWTKERNLLEVESVKALLLVKVNFDLSCAEMRKMISGNKKILEKIHSGEKYKPFE